MEKTETIPPKIRNETRVPTLPSPIQHHLGILSHSNKTGRRNKRNTNRKKSNYLFTNNMILYLKDLKKLLDIIDSFSKVTGYKIYKTTMNKLRKNIGKQLHLQYLKKKKKT
jgi:hypothetical protein